VALAVAPGVTVSPPETTGGAETLPVRRWGRREPSAPSCWDTFRDTLRAVADAVEAKDAYTRAHSRRVARYAAALASELRMGSRAAKEIRFGGLLHDVGKIGVPDTVLRKTGPLGEREWRRVRRHPIIGEHILGPLLRAHPRILAAVRWHHERFDGSGFPDGLRGEEIPFEARIVAVVDAYDAMTTERPYRGALPMRSAVRELRRGSGTQFDPWCVAAFLRLLKRPCRTPRQVRRRAARLPPVTPQGSKHASRGAVRARCGRGSADRAAAHRRAVGFVSGPSGRPPAESGRRTRPRAPPTNRRDQHHPSVG
jgi:HD-GYP domain-containing protein (c-di-GMP phosphodiesterase class II)